MAQYKNSGIRLDGESADRSLTGLAAAWVQFNGITTTTINGSFNVSSLTDNGTGDTTVSFTTSFNDANWVASSTCKEDHAAGGAGRGMDLDRRAPTVSYSRWDSYINTNNSQADLIENHAIHMGDLA